MTKKNNTHPPRWSYNQVKKRAENFLKDNHPDLSIPVPIEYILEFKLNLRLIATPDLKRKFGIDGFIDSEFDSITVDKYTFDNYEFRVRFTIAHELGHLILHKSIYKQCEFEGLSGYLEFQDNIPTKDIEWLDKQANWFAGCLLVPTFFLEQELKKIADEVDVPVNNLIDNIDQVGSCLENLPGKFKVSSDVLWIQLKKERLL